MEAAEEVAGWEAMTEAGVMVVDGEVKPMEDLLVHGVAMGALEDMEVDGEAVGEVRDMAAVVKWQVAPEASEAVAAPVEDAVHLTRNCPQKKVAHSGNSPLKHVPILYYDGITPFTFKTKKYPAATQYVLSKKKEKL